MSRHIAASLCPCGRLSSTRTPLTYAACCGRYLDHGADAPAPAPAPDAESLMRSRYTAFVREDAHYLLATWHASTRPPALNFDSVARWLGLEVRQHQRLDATHAEVEFVARHRLAGRAVRQHETSRFVCEDGRWWYVDGDQR